MKHIWRRPLVFLLAVVVIFLVFWQFLNDFYCESCSVCVLQVPTCPASTAPAPSAAWRSVSTCLWRRSSCSCWWSSWWTDPCAPSPPNCTTPSSTSPTASCDTEAQMYIYDWSVLEFISSCFVDTFDGLGFPPCFLCCVQVQLGNYSILDFSRLEKLSGSIRGCRFQTVAAWRDFTGFYWIFLWSSTRSDNRWNTERYVFEGKLLLKWFLKGHKL